jgi:poly-gamma-glutamate capsule biosynthesis protein CapA/YwtB (metallophosphatase superfamily)
MLGGDVMLGRLVAEAIERFGHAYPLAPVAGLLRRADLTIVNLECALTDARARWPGPEKRFYFGAPSVAVLSLVDAGIDLVSLANNHALDFGVDGLRDTLRLLSTHQIGSAGAGADRDEACAPALLTRQGVRFGMAAFCDHQADFAAQKARAGTAWLDLDDERGTMLALSGALERLLRAGVDWPILSLHWGPNMVERPSPKFRRLAHAAIDMGWKILYGHSAHVFQGIELYRDCPIVYAAGDLVDDYAIDPGLRNDHQVLFELELTPLALCGVCLHPICIEQCQARTANGAEFDAIATRMRALCGELGTVLHRARDVLWIEPTAA